MKKKLSEYFYIKTGTKDFHQNMQLMIADLKDKKVLIYGAGGAFLELNKLYNLCENFNIVAIADKKFEKNACANFCGLKAIKPSDITSEEFDVIIITNEFYEPIVKFLNIDLQIEDKNIITIFEQKIFNERNDLNYLYGLNLEKKISKLSKKLKNKNVVLYGAGTYCKLLFEYFDLSNKFNISAISDMKFTNTDNCDLNGYKTCHPQDIKVFNPDYVLIATKYYINIFEYLHYDLLKDTKIKILPLIDKPLCTLIKDMWINEKHTLKQLLKKSDFS